MLEINIIPTQGHGMIPDVVFPRANVVAAASSGQPGPPWMGGNSFRMTGKTIKELGVDGKPCGLFSPH